MKIHRKVPTAIAASMIPNAFEIPCAVTVIAPVEPRMDRTTFSNGSFRIARGPQGRAPAHCLTLPKTV